MKTDSFTFRLFFLALSSAALTACGGSGSGVDTESSFAPVSGGAVTNDLDPAASGTGTVSEPGVGLVAFASGLDFDANVAGFAGIQAGANVGAPVTSGTAGYNGEYGLEITDNARLDDGVVRASGGISRGPIALSADFDAGTLTGSGSSTSGAFGTDVTVNGTISGSTVGGAVLVEHVSSGLTPGNLNTVLAGEIGSTAVIGAFHGHDGNTVVGGGFIATNP